MLQNVWDFFQDEILGMKWLNRLIGSGLEAAGLDTGGKVGEQRPWCLVGRSYTVLLLFFHSFIYWIYQCGTATWCYVFISYIFANG